MKYAIPERRIPFVNIAYVHANPQCCMAVRKYIKGGDGYMGVESSNLASSSNTAIYKLMLSHMGESVAIATTAGNVIAGILEGVQQSYATIRLKSGDAEYVILAYIVSVAFPTL